MHGRGLETGIDNLRIAALTHAQVTDLLAVAALCGAADGGAPSSQTARRRARARARAAPRFRVGDGPRG